MLCQPRDDAASDDGGKTVMEGFVIKKKHKEYILGVLTNRDNFSQYIDLSKFGYYFGVTLKIQEWLKSKWFKVDLQNRRNEFIRQQVNEVVFPKLKFLIRKGVPLETMKQYILSLFAITNINTEIEYNLAYKLLDSSASQQESPTFGQKKRLEKLLTHHCLTPAGIQVTVLLLGTQNDLNYIKKDDTNSPLFTISSCRGFFAADLSRKRWHFESPQNHDRWVRTDAQRRWST